MTIEYTINAGAMLPTGTPTQEAVRALALEIEEAIRKATGEQCRVAVAWHVQGPDIIQGEISAEQRDLVLDAAGKTWEKWVSALTEADYEESYRTLRRA